MPHPAFDLRTELFGIDLFRRVPGAVLLVAGAHRKADDSKADVAHEEDSVFHVVATALAGRGLPQVQLHGFHDQNLPSTDIVLSSGATTADDTVFLHVEMSRTVRESPERRADVVRGLTEAGLTKP
ncbi:hypothetical protein [Amycolatopsis rifamycinica]|uniref:hypothetical protein n=1 Tax=Amycolatopsis rifamycinica TaxID=287986 RepID=UPI00068CBC64|nr:hypothetical protein [Amycolatopsis rifamycinica]